MTAEDVTVPPKILSGNSVTKEKGYGMNCMYLLDKLSPTPLLDDNGDDLVGFDHNKYLLPVSCEMWQRSGTKRQSSYRNPTLSSSKAGQRTMQEFFNA